MLQALSYNQEFQQIKGLVIGRFPAIAQVSEEYLRKSIERKPISKKIPIIANLDFGHTTPIFTFPIGGRAQIDGKKLTITGH